MQQRLVRAVVNAVVTLNAVLRVPIGSLCVFLNVPRKERNAFLVTTAAMACVVGFPQTPEPPRVNHLAISLVIFALPMNVVRDFSVGTTPVLSVPLMEDVVGTMELNAVTPQVGAPLVKRKVSTSVISARRAQTSLVRT